ncbi:MAG: hypothetical protein HY901_11615 [Deltaproteobacteria bacterium]|nr:hypothetical protein [Deltaproteobacteria bacterium]
MGINRVAGTKITPRVDGSNAMAKQVESIVKDHAAAQARLFFGPEMYKTSTQGSTFVMTGPHDNDTAWKFSKDFKNVDITSGEDGIVEHLKVNNPEGFRQHLTASVMKSVLNGAAEATLKRIPEMEGMVRVEGPTMADNSLLFTLTGPADGDTRVAYNLKTGVLKFSDEAGEKSVKVGRSQAAVVDAMASYFRLSLPLIKDD